MGGGLINPPPRVNPIWFYQTKNQTNLFFPKIYDHKISLTQKIFWSKKIFDQKKFSNKNFLHPPKNLTQKFYWLKEILTRKIFWPKNFLTKKFLLPQNSLALVTKWYYYKTHQVQPLGSVQVLRQRVWGGVGGQSQNADMLTLWREEVGELKHRTSITVKCFKITIN